jgi:hypothetical protein
VCVFVRVKHIRITTGINFLLRSSKQASSQSQYKKTSAVGTESLDHFWELILLSVYKQFKEHQNYGSSWTL